MHSSIQRCISTLAKENLIAKVQALVIGGAMANTFMYAQGVNVQKSLAEKDMADTARRIMAKAEDANCAIILPVDAIVAFHFQANAPSHAYGLDAIPSDGMILDVGAWALRQAVSNYQRWVDEKLVAPGIAVNVSAIQLRHRDFTDIVRDAVRSLGESAVMGIEITESVIMDDIEPTVAKLRTIRDMGLNIAIDDFGTLSLSR